MELAPGTVLLGKYRIDEVIGSGGMGNVVRASHLYLHQAVAIKILLEEMAQSDSTKQRFLREAQATVKLKSEHSARVMDVGTTPTGVPFMVMEFLEGNDLNQILRHHGPQVPAIVVDLMLQACEGIAEAHALGIIHRDIKPSNFFITRRPDGSMLLKILDFGISKTPIDYGELTGTQTVIGTPSYMAPEQMKSGRSADPRSDIWSIGVVIYQLITGRPPFAGESYADLVLKVGLEPPAPILVPLPNGLAEVILRCLEKDPNARHQHVGELARMLAPYATDPIAAAQSAGRAMRILQQRGAQLGTQASPLTSGGGLSTPIPISPAQLTPRSWPRSQGTSLSQGAGQMTMRTRGNRGLLVAGVLTLCVLAGVGGYAASQMSKSDVPPRNEPHVMAPAPTAAPAKPPEPTTAAVSPGEPKPAAVNPSEPKPTIAKPDELKPAAIKADEPKPTIAKPDEPKPADPKPAAIKTDEPKPALAKPADPKPAAIKTDEPKPTLAKPADPRPAAIKTDEAKLTLAKPADPKPAAIKTDEPKPAGAKPADPKPAAVKTDEPKPTGAKPVSTKPADPKPAAVKTDETKPTGTKPTEPKPAAVKSAEPKPTGTKPADPKPAAVKTDETKPAGTKPAEPKPAGTKPTKPVKPKKSDDLFDSRH